MVEAILFGTPEGIVCRVTLTQPGMRHEVWEQLVPAESSISDMIRRFWEDPAGTAIVPAGR